MGYKNLAQVARMEVYVQPPKLQGYHSSLNGREGVDHVISESLLVAFNISSISDHCLQQRGVSHLAG
ncbi:hypothetical protein J6590_000469 [Homalodisca vitripennis]|nr:hypothetical protein J6590_000469 [Homalodisca vitripennis]